MLPSRPQPNYRLNCGQYVLHNGDQPVYRVLDEIALALDKEEGALCKYGDPVTVEAWAAKERARMRSIGHGWEESADNLIVITGRFPLAELNRCLSNHGYAGTLYRKLLAGELQAEPWV
jgi:hypothetical protein